MSYEGSNMMLFRAPYDENQKQFFRKIPFPNADG